MRNTRFSNVATVLLLILLSLLPLHAEKKKEVKDKANEKDKILSVEQLIKRYRIGNLKYSKPRNQVSMTVSEPVSGASSKQQIWLYDLNNGDFRQLTYASDRSRSPGWSPDGSTLAFLASRNEKKTQIFLLPMDKGGEAVPLTDGESGVQSFKWSHDGSFIVFATSSPPDEEKQKKIKEKDDAQVISEETDRTELHRIDLKTKEVKTLFNDENLSVSSYTLTHDNKKVIFSARNPHKAEYFTTKIYSLEMESKSFKELLAPDGPFYNLDISKDGKTLAFIGSEKGGPVEHDVYLLPLNGGKVQNLTGKTIDLPVYDYQWLEDGSILVDVSDGFGLRMIQFDSKGKFSDPYTFDKKTVGNFVKTDNALVFVQGDDVTPSELWIRDKKGERQISSFHKDYPELIRPELFTYKAKDGLEIEAALFKPEKTGKGKLPLITLIHGGPSGRWSHRINLWAQLLVARGYAVFTPNIRGSIGYGIDFLRTIRNDWGGKDWQDIMTGVDTLIEKGIADPGKLGIGGWSYGGYMSAWAVTQTDRFKAAIIGAPMTDLAVEYGAETPAINPYDTWYLGNPYENMKDFDRMSPMTFIKNVKTPSLILTGENDVIDPPAQSKMFYRALRRLKVDTELVIYPREGHGLREEKHQLDMNNRVIEWFRKYVK